MAAFGDPFVINVHVVVLLGGGGDPAKQYPVDKRSKMPITPGILAKVHSVMAESAQEPDGIMLCVANCLCFSISYVQGKSLPHPPHIMIHWPT